MTAGERRIAHFDLDTFFVSVERKHDRRLNGVPVIVGGGIRGVVASCSYEARVFGVRSGMSMRQARVLCPDAIVVSGDHELYSKESRLVTQVIADSAPLYEKASIDEFYMDVSGMGTYCASAGKFLTELKGKIHQHTGLPITYALASNKLVSKVATNEVKPNGKTEVDFGEEKSYLAPLRVEKMPGIGEKTSLILKDWGIKTIKLLSETPVEILTHKFGKAGSDMSRKANGIDESPVIPFSEQKSISTEQTFDNDTIDVQFLRGQLIRMTERISFELRQQSKMTGCVTVKIKYGDFTTVTKQCSIGYTASDHVLISTAKDLFDRLYDRRILVKLLGIRYSDLVAGHPQISLFEHTQETVRLYQTLDEIRKKFGAGAVMRAIGVEKKK